MNTTLLPPLDVIASVTLELFSIAVPSTALITSLALSPAFSADCLETLEELALQNAELSLQEGGQAYAYIPALNSREDHLEFLADLLRIQLDAVTRTFLAH
mgnify:CR=1 FL=1